MVSAEELYRRLRPPSSTLTRKLSAVGIPITKAYEMAEIDSRSDECAFLLKAIAESELADSCVFMEFRFHPRRKELSVLDVAKRSSPFIELTNEIIRGLDCETESYYEKFGMDGAARLLSPASTAIARALQVLKHPDPIACPLTHSFPVGTYITNVEIQFRRWAFAVRVYRE